MGDRLGLYPTGTRPSLVYQDSLNYLAPLVRLMVGTVQPLPAFLKAFRSGDGGPFGDYGPDMHEGQAGA